MSEVAYTFKKHTETGECHIFEGKFKAAPPPLCTIVSKSICKKMETDDGEYINANCLKEQGARDKAATLGRNVCGICVSHLYASYNDDK